MVNLFNLSDEKLKEMFNDYFVQCNKNEEYKKYSELERRQQKRFRF